MPDRDVFAGIYGRLVFSRLAGHGAPAEPGGPTPDPAHPAPAGRAPASGLLDRLALMAPARKAARRRPARPA